MYSAVKKLFGAMFYATDFYEDQHTSNLKYIKHKKVQWEGCSNQEKANATEFMRQFCVSNRKKYKCSRQLAMRIWKTESVYL